jgi:hypothetical protein
MAAVESRLKEVIFVELARSTKERTRQPPPHNWKRMQMLFAHPQKPIHYNVTILQVTKYKLQFYNLQYTGRYMNTSF